jgi:hypothetical protein
MTRRLPADVKKGVAGDGRKIICEDMKGWRWEIH